jgi:hypothetical protein
MGTVRIAEHTFELPDDGARELGMAAIAVAAKGGFLAATPSLLIYVTQSTQISVQIDGEFGDMPTPKQVLENANRKRSGPRIAHVL